MGTMNYLNNHEIAYFFNFRERLANFYFLLFEKDRPKSYLPEENIV